jgi:hypothetical protein
MNSLSVVLAADSASTVEYFESGKTERRYFKGSNKIFQLSSHNPIGLMIYNNSSLLGVPWEVTIKEYRRQLGTNTFNHVQDYAEHFVTWVDDNLSFFPEVERKAHFVQVVRSSIFMDLIEFQKVHQADNTYSFKQHVDETHGHEKLNAEEVGLSEEEIESLFEACKDEIERELGDILQMFTVVSAGADLVKARREYFNRAVLPPSRDGNHTGLVFAGFGERQVFPEVVAFQNCQMHGTKFVAMEETVDRVDYRVPAVIKAFAQTSMIDTFSLGLSGEIFVTVQEALAEELRLMANEINGKVGTPLSKADISKLIAERLQGSSERILGHAREKHSLPLRRVLGVLPVDEMAELAETLINLQSLKEKVTRPSETVGGPVDVAAITKSEGLVWIRRKHFFDAGLNARYFQRQGS